MDDLLNNTPNQQLLDPLGDGELSIIQTPTRRFMYVPPKYLPIVLARRLTPRELWTDLVGAIRANGNLGDCKELVDWCMLALMRSALGALLASCLPSPAPPLADGTFL